MLTHGAGTLDRVAAQASGAGEREAKVRVAALAGFEHGVLSIIACPAAIVALVLGEVIPRTDCTWPWAIAPLPGLLVAAVLAARYRDRLRERDGAISSKVAIFLDAVHLVVVLLRHPRRTGFAAAGMALYWGADALALWAATSAFGVHMRVTSTIIVLATGMLASRRTAPLGGAGLLGLALVPAVWYGAAVPFAVATLGVAAYQFLTLWAPLPASLFVLPVLRALPVAEATT
jgi:hypothetical protein